MKHSLLSRVWAKFANFVNRHPFLSEMRVLGLKPLFKHKLTFTNFFIIIQLLILVLRITLDKTKSKREEEQITWFCKKKYMHKETLINIITCTRTTPPPPRQQWYFLPLKCGGTQKSMVQTSNIQTPNLKSPTYAKTYIGIDWCWCCCLKQDSNRCRISLLKERWGGPKRS